MILSDCRISERFFNEFPMNLKYLQDFQRMMQRISTDFIAIKRISKVFNSFANIPKEFKIFHMFSIYFTGFHVISL